MAMLSRSPSPNPSPSSFPLTSTSTRSIIAQMLREGTTSILHDPSSPPSDASSAAHLSSPTNAEEYLSSPCSSYSFSSSSLSSHRLFNAYSSELVCRCIDARMKFTTQIPIIYFPPTKEGEKEEVTFLLKTLQETKNTTVCVLNLNWARHLSVETMIVLSAFLTVNTTIQRLLLSNSGITDEGARHLAAALRRNNTLRELDLSDNPLTIQTGYFLKYALESSTNTSLEIIDLSYSPSPSSPSSSPRSSGRGRGVPIWLALEIQDLLQPHHRLARTSMMFTRRR